jgi:hypothetical protein
MGFTVDKVRLSRFLANVRQEILNIQFGEPKWRTGPPLHFEEGKAVPVMAVLERLQEVPSKDNFDAFIRQASQDLGKPTGDGFATWGQGIFTKVDDKGETVAPSKSFADSIKDGLYDCFKAGHISMDQKQVDLIGKASARMAKAFQAEISKGIATQLDVLVKRTKEAEKNDD